MVAASFFIFLVFIRYSFPSQQPAGRDTLQSTINRDMPAPKARYSYAQAILGQQLFERVEHARILCVGAGGIGCEVLKNLVQVGFGDITIVCVAGSILLIFSALIASSIIQIDLDTIDLSNLNRQFLFQKQHVKRPKAIVAKETASNFNPHVNITAIHGNIKEQQYDVDWFGSFDLVLNALDNLGRQADRHTSFLFT